MTDLKIMVDAARQLNQTWSTCSKDIEKEDDTSKVYNAMCEIDEAIINLVKGTINQHNVWQFFTCNYT